MNNAYNLPPKQRIVPLHSTSQNTIYEDQRLTDSVSTVGDSLDLRERKDFLQPPTTFQATEKAPDPKEQNYRTNALQNSMVESVKIGRVLVSSRIDTLQCEQDTKQLHTTPLSLICLCMTLFISMQHPLPNVQA